MSSAGWWKGCAPRVENWCQFRRKPRLYWPVSTMSPQSSRRPVFWKLLAHQPPCLARVQSRYELGLGAAHPMTLSKCVSRLGVQGPASGDRVPC